MHQNQIRWKQRFNNLNKAFNTLKRAVWLKNPNEIEKQWIIQSFEFTFELAWKTMKDYLENQGVETWTPREVIKHAFSYKYIDDWALWIDILDKRNLLSHTYDEKKAEEALSKIRLSYYQAIDNLHKTLQSKIKD